MDGQCELIVYYFNKIVQFYRIEGNNKYTYLGESYLNEPYNIPFKIFVLDKCDREKSLFLFAPNYIYEYDILHKFT